MPQLTTNMEPDRRMAGLNQIHFVGERCVEVSRGLLPHRAEDMSLNAALWPHKPVEIDDTMGVGGWGFCFGGALFGLSWGGCPIWSKRIFGSNPFSSGLYMYIYIVYIYIRVTWNKPPKRNRWTAEGAFTESDECGYTSK